MGGDRAADPGALTAIPAGLTFGRGLGRAGRLPRGLDGPGAFWGNTRVDGALLALVTAGAARYKWVAATEGSQEAAPIELASGGDAVVAIGGFDGSDLASLSGFAGFPAGPRGGSSAIASWVAAHFTVQAVGGTPVYNLTKPAS